MPVKSCYESVDVKTHAFGERGSPLVTGDQVWCSSFTLSVCAVRDLNGD